MRKMLSNGNYLLPAFQDTLHESRERLMQPRMIEALQKQTIGMFVVDEAHCISKWALTSGPDYEELSS